VVKTFYDTLAIEENRCPEGCMICQEVCRETAGIAGTGCSGIKPIHLPQLGVHTALTCNQCGEPVCMDNCPTGAISKGAGDGVVRIDQGKCLGCGMCSLVCPYGGIHYSQEQRRTFKCDLCGGVAKCAEACPEGVIKLARSREVALRLQDDQLRRGTPLCLGCPAELALRFTLRVLGKDTVLFGAPGCAVLLICGMGTRTYCLLPSHMTNMTNLPSTAAGYKRYLRKLGKDVKCVCFAGDGCFADVGFQPLSGAAERGENIIAICYDNEGFMNTGIQRSGTTSYLSWTTTTPVGVRKRGKERPAKNMPLIMAAHDIPYVATATIGFPEDYAEKLNRAMEVKDGMSYIHLLSPCPTGWRFSTALAIEVCRLAVETNYFPLWEYAEGRYRFTYQPKKPRPIADFLRTMRKFDHLTERDVGEIQALVDRRLETIRSLAHMGESEGGDLS